jgi:hypothetical protein
MVKEKTLIFDGNIIKENIGFRSPWPIRIKLAMISLTGRLQSVTWTSVDGGFIAYGWIGHDPYVEFVTVIKRLNIITQIFP